MLLSSMPRLPLTRSLRFASALTSPHKRGEVKQRTDLPDRHSVDSSVQPFPQKYFASSPGRNTFKPHAVPPSHEGRIAIVTDVGCGMRWTRRCHETNDTAADGEAVWS